MAGATAPFNRLEPAALVRHFAEHPPEGFEVLHAGDPDEGDGSAAAFAAPFGRLTTANAALRRTVRALPLHRHWRALLRWRTAFVGTTVTTEYALLPRGRDPGRQVARWRSAWGRRYPLLIVKDLPRQSPLLSPDENQAADAFASACAREGFVLLEGQALAYVPIDFPDIDTYLGLLSTSRRKLRSLEGLDVRVRPTGDSAYADERTLDTCYAVYLAVYAQSEMHFDKLSRDFFAKVLRGSGSIVFEYRPRDALDGPPIGWNLCFEAGGKLIDKYIGLAYPAAREHNLYFVSWMVNLRRAIERGLTHYVAGWTAPEVKAQLGASFTFTRHALRPRNPLLRMLMRRLAEHFELDQQVLEPST